MKLSPGTKKNNFFLAFTLDIDPDANTAVKGRLDALSYPLENGRVDIEATAKGLTETLKLLEELSLPATLFFEARTAQLLAERLDLITLTKPHEIACHSLRHEDFLGRVSGIPLGMAQSQDIIAESRAMLEDMFQKKVVGFRAPYLRANRDMLSVLAELEFKYDSSFISDCLRPFCVTNSNPLWEFPVASLRHGLHKRLTSYLIPLFQGRRSTQEYLHSIETLSRKTFRMPAGAGPSEALFILAFHPWELFVDHSGRPYNNDVSKELFLKVKNLVSGLKETTSLEFITLEGFLQRYLHLER